MYLTQKDNGKTGLSVVDAGIFPLLIGMGISAAARALRKKGERGEGNRQDRESARQQENEFLINKPNFAEDAVWDRRKKGFVADPSVWSDIMGSQAGGGKIYGSRLDPKKLFAAMGGGQFGEDLRNTQMADIRRPNFKPEERKGSFLGDLGIGLLGGAGQSLMSMDEINQDREESGQAPSAYPSGF